MALSSSDEEMLIRIVNDALSRLPFFLKSSLNKNTLLTYLRMTPQQVRNYTINEIIECLEKNINSDKIKI